MKKILFVMAAIFSLSFTQPANAQSAAEVFTEYTNPHAVCDYYRSQEGFTVERESDTECLVSNGSGEGIVYTQYYYSGDNWCVRIIQFEQDVFKDCIPIPDSGLGDFVPFIIVGVVVFVIIIIFASSSAGGGVAAKAAAAQAKGPVKSGRGSYAWETPQEPTPGKPLPTIEEEALEKLAKESHKSKKARSTGGTGVQQGEGSVAQEIEKLAKLKSQGAITQKEFTQAKKKLLG